GALSRRRGAGGGDGACRHGLCRNRGDAAPTPAFGAAGMRLFVALSLPRAVRQQLMLLQGGVPGARWMPEENLHLTLRFIGEVDGADMEMLDDALAMIAAPDF